MEDRLLVSIVIPVYNTEEYLEECLDSVIKQLLGDVEIICIDDGSTDDSLNILKKYADADPRVKVITGVNCGQAVARNRGIMLARGEFVYFLDSDDWIDLNLFSDLIPIMIKEDLDIMYFDGEPYLQNYELGKQFEYAVAYNQRNREYGEIMSGELLFEQLIRNDDYQVSPAKQIFRRNFLFEKGLFFPEGILHEDELFIFKTMLLAQRVSHRKRKYYHRRIRLNSIMSSPKTYNNFYGYYTSYIEMVHFAKEKQYTIANADYVWKKIERIYKSAIRIYQALDDNEKKEIELPKESDIFELHTEN